MQKRNPVLEKLARGQSVVLDGALASELTRRGYRPTGPMLDAAAPREAPEVLAAIHRAYIDAGAEVITAFTARSTVRTLAKGGLGMRAAALTSQAVDIALDAGLKSGRPVAVAGVLSSLEDPLRPERTPSARTLADEHGEQAARLLATGCDLILVEAMPTVRETLAATAAAHAVMPNVWTTLALTGRAQVGDGAALDDAASYSVAVGAQAVLIESGSMPDLTSAVSTLAGLALGVPLGARASLEPGESSAVIDRFAGDLLLVMQRGARIVGGARGTTPDHIRALAARVRARAAA